ncbi:MAG: cytidylate kinase-like family protein [Bacteroidales bacterium]|nr:cytidylate kinase-like family protein [Bacteroidales bacterium]
MNGKKTIIVIGRQFGSGGKLVAETIGRILDIPVYDKELIAKAAEESGFSKELFRKSDEKRNLFSISSFFSSGRFGPGDNYVGDNELFKIQSKVIQGIAEEGSAVFVGRCADYILRETDRLSVFITAPLEDRIRRVCGRMGTDRNEASSMIQKVDRSRAAYYNFFSFGDWGVASNYDLCVDSSILGIEKTAEMIISFGKEGGKI